MAEPTIQLGGGNWAGKTDNLLGYYKEGERFYKQDFTFSRSTSGTRVNSSGLIETAQIIGSELVTNGDFSGVANGTDVVTLSGWGTYGSVTSRNIESEQLKLVSPSGTTNVGVVLSVSTTSGSLYRFTYTASGDLGVNGIYIDGVGAYNSSTEQNITFTAPSSTTYIYFRPGENNGGTAYFDNISVKEVIQNNIPRVDYLNNSNGSLILEPQRTNLVTQSQNFDSWTKTNVSVTANNTISPDGTTNADKISANGSGQHYIQSANYSFVSSTNYTYSIFAKKSNTSLIQLIAPSGVFGSNAFASYNFDTLEVTEGTSATASMEDYGNGWYRLILKCTSTNSASVSSFYVVFTNDKSIRIPSFTANNEDAFVWGAQTEIANYPTTLINTSGSSVTRNADACSITNVADRIGQTEGVLFAEIAAFEGANTDRQISISDGSTSNRVVMALLTNGTQIQFVVISGGSVTVNNTQTIPTITSGTKIAFSYKANDFKVYSNGVLILSDTSGAVPIGLNTLSFDRGDGGDNFYGKTKQIQVYNTALSDTELATLTTL